MYLSDDVFFAAEAAAHQRCDHSHLVGFYAQRSGGLIAVAVRNLAAHINRRLVMLCCFASHSKSIAAATEGRGNVTSGYADRALRLKKQVFGSGCAISLVDDYVGVGKAGLNITFIDLDVL